MPSFEFCGVTKIFDGQTVLRDVSFVIPQGGRSVLLGPSGAGKSTILQLLAGLKKPDAGEVICTARRISYVFDRPMLYDALTCLENIECGLPMGRKQKKQIEQKALHWASIFQCTSFLHQKASTLSAGQRQRTALARAMMKDPDLLLMDESLGALDGALRWQLMASLIRLHEEKAFTMVYVTHSFEEALTMGEHVFLVEKDCVRPVSSAAELLCDPASLYAAGSGGLFGMNIMPAAWFDPSWQGWAALALEFCSPVPKTGWKRLECRFDRIEDFGWCRMAFFSRDQFSLRIPSVEEMPADAAFWYDPAELEFFADDFSASGHDAP